MPAMHQPRSFAHNIDFPRKSTSFCKCGFKNYERVVLGIDYVNWRLSVHLCLLYHPCNILIYQVLDRVITWIAMRGICSLIRGESTHKYMTFITINAQDYLCFTLSMICQCHTFCHCHCITLSAS